MRTSLAAALFILLSAAAGAGLVAPDLFLLFQRFKLRRNRIEFRQKRLAYISGNGTGTCPSPIFFVIMLTYTIRDVLINSAIP